MSAEYRAALGACQPGEECGNCGLRQIRLEHEAWNVEDQVLRRGGVDFHIHDFVYLRPDTPAPALYMIGQIVKVDLRAKPGQSFRAGVRVYARYDAAANKDSDHENKDEVRFFACPPLFWQHNNSPLAPPGIYKSHMRLRHISHRRQSICSPFGGFGRARSRRVG